MPISKSIFTPHHLTIVANIEKHGEFLELIVNYNKAKQVGFRVFIEESIEPLLSPTYVRIGERPPVK